MEKYLIILYSIDYHQHYFQTFSFLLLYVVQAGLFPMSPAFISECWDCTCVTTLACYFTFKVYFIIFNYVCDSYLQS